MQPFDHKGPRRAAPKGQPPTNKTPPEKIARIRKLYSQGVAATVIADTVGVAYISVMRHCADLPKPPRPKRLKPKEITNLLVSWRPCR